MKPTMKQYDIPFSIDNSVGSKPNFNMLHILYNEQDYNKVMKIVDGLTLAQISLAHISMGDVQFQIDINKENLLTFDTEVKIINHFIKNNNT